MMTGPGKVYTIPPGTPFLDALAAGLLEQAGGPEALADMTVLLPTRRACRALVDAFSRMSGGRALLLPCLRPIGDIDEDDLMTQDGAWNEGEDVALDLPPAIPPMRRLLIIAGLLGKANRDWSEPDTITLAGDLARLLDQVQIEELSFEQLADLAPEDFADHWQKVLGVLSVITEIWPELLEKLGFMEAIARRTRLIDRQIARWQDAPPDHPVIAAGSTGTVPATARLLGAVARLPEGAVVLPGLDTHLDEQSWQALEPTHPQFGMRQLLEKIEVARTAVQPWPAAARLARPPAQARMALLSEALRPAETTPAWREFSDIPEAALDGLVRIDAPGPREEAGAIAMIMRECLETPDRTAALVTPDRRLARRVAAELHRWGIEIDDSGGRPLAETPPGTYLRLLANLFAEDAAPVPSLALLKHPLAAGGQNPGRFRAQVRALERAVLRGPRPGPGLAGIETALREDKDGRRLLSWFRGVRDRLAPLEAVFARPSCDLGKLLRTHVEVGENLAASDEEDGAARLWAGEAGEAAARFVADLEAAADAFGEVAPRRYPALIDALMGGTVVRPRFGGHPRLQIWGLLEARLQSADVMILGGLNERVWPPEVAPDPWMSRPMRAKFGLPAPERRIGLSAHDFMQAACAEHVVITRAEKVDGAPTVPSRWLQRLDALAGDDITRGRDWLAWFAGLEAPERVKPVAPPAPTPPVQARPRKLSVTEAETWKRDPYALYAKRILKLRPLDPVDADPGAAERGSFIHSALDAFVRAFPDGLPEDALEQLLDCGRQVFAEVMARPAVRAFWWPRFEVIARWFIDVERDRRDLAKPLATEVKGQMDITDVGAPFALKARADRIDRLADGTLAIIDYKTGSAPSAKVVKAGYAPQLPLEAVLARSGGFEGIAAAPVSELAYWKLTGRGPGGEIKRLKLDVEAEADKALEWLKRMIAAFDKERTPYLSRPRPDHAGYGEYDHLARVLEWAPDTRTRR